MMRFAGNSKSRLLWGNLPGSSVPKKFYFLLRCAHPAKAFSLKVARPLAETASRTPSEGLKSTVAKPLPETALRIKNLKRLILFSAAWTPRRH